MHRAARCERSIPVQQSREAEHLRNGEYRMLTARQALLGLALLIAGVGDSSGQSQQPSPSPGIASQPPQAQPTQTNKPADANQRGTEDAPFIVKILPPAEGQQKPAADTNNEHKKPTGEDKIADFTERLYWATFGLAVVAFFQLLVFGWQGIQLRRTVNHLAISERAHVSGGANRGTTTDGREVLVITANNYGKTQATIGTVAATICDESELDAFPGWEVNNWAGHVFVKGWKGYVFWQISGQQIDVVLPFQSGKVVAGRIWYRDIFKKQYSVGFLLKTDGLTAVGRKSFWEEREEKDPNG
jgi:hypothetical protein